MSDQIKQIAERLQGLRDVLELTPDEVAKSCQLSVEEYLGMESGEKDISVSALQKIARENRKPMTDIYTPWSVLPTLLNHNGSENKNSS